MGYMGAYPGVGTCPGHYGNPKSYMYMNYIQMYIRR